ncbi:MAG: class I adenylate-forming enzyme family protein [Pseudomonadota bacterium]
MIYQPIDHLRYQAAMRPNAIALQSLDRGMSFRDLYQRVRRIAHKLRNTGVMPGDVVLTVLGARTAGWLVTLALLHEATIGAVAASVELPDPALRVRWLITDSTNSVWPIEQVIVLDQEWLADLPSGDIYPQRYSEAESVCRLIMTSGTTGHAKAVPMSVDLLNLRLAGVVGYWCTAKPELNLMSISTIGGFMSAFHALVEGNPCFQYREMSEAIALVQRFNIVNLAGSPMQLAAFAQQVVMLGTPPLTLELIRSAGGMLSVSLLKTLSNCTNARVVNVYGSTEAGGIATADAGLLHQQPALAGFIRPNIDIQIVNDNHEVQQPDTIGIIRVRSLAMAQHYFRNEAASAESFRDGWFYPGDTGQLNTHGQLILAGRSSELINCGGIKMDPVSIDSFIQSQPGIEDAAVFGYQNANGIQAVAAALIVPAGFVFAELQKSIAARFGRYAVPERFIVMKRIPRNEMGKIQRAQLARMLEQNEQVERGTSRQ